MNNHKIISRFEVNYRFLSNFSSYSVIAEGYTHRTLEHAYQSAKTDDLDEKAMVRGTATARLAKKAGQVVTLRTDWEFVRVSIMLDLVRRKFDVHSAIREQLLATGDARLIEGNTWGDVFWGMCNSKGENWLGRILMHVRGEYQK